MVDLHTAFYTPLTHMNYTNQNLLNQTLTIHFKVSGERESSNKARSLVWGVWAHLTQAQSFTKLALQFTGKNNPWILQFKPHGA